MIARNRALGGNVFFPLGRVVATPGALRALQEAGESPSFYLSRHARGDWGDVCPEDSAENTLALREGFRIMSVYETAKGTRLWIISEADRSVTTLLLPEEY